MLKHVKPIWDQFGQGKTMHFDVNIRQTHIPKHKVSEIHLHDIPRWRLRFQGVWNRHQGMRFQRTLDALLKLPLQSEGNCKPCTLLQSFGLVLG